MSEAALERLYAAFAEFMTPDESGEPLLLAKDLKHALDAAAIPSQLAPQLLKLMDPGSEGTISFEQFSKVCNDVIGVDFESENCSDSNSNEGGFDLNESNDDDFNDEYDEDDEDYVEHDAQKATQEEYDDIHDKSVQNDVDSTRDHIFDSMKDKTGRITVASLGRQADKLKFNVPRSDLEQMVQMASTEKEFKQLWKHLQ